MPTEEKKRHTSGANTESQLPQVEGHFPAEKAEASTHRRTRDGSEPITVHKGTPQEQRIKHREAQPLKVTGR
jgi:hypothetical protein